MDATAPGGGLADPGSPLRGTVNLSASPSDTGVGVQQVVFQSSPADAGTWSPIATDTTSPYTASWDTTGVADGLYDLRILVTDNVGNSFASAVVEDRLVDNTDPTAVMNDPGAYLKWHRQPDLDHGRRGLRRLDGHLPALARRRGHMDETSPRRGTRRAPRTASTTCASG